MLGVPVPGVLVPGCWGAAAAGREGDSLAGGEVVPAAALIDGLASILSAGFCLPAGGGREEKGNQEGRKDPGAGGAAGVGVPREGAPPGLSPGCRGDGWPGRGWPPRPSILARRGQRGQGPPASGVGGPKQPSETGRGLHILAWGAAPPPLWPHCGVWPHKELLYPENPWLSPPPTHHTHGCCWGRWLHTRPLGRPGSLPRNKPRGFFPFPVPRFFPPLSSPPATAPEEPPRTRDPPGGSGGAMGRCPPHAELSPPVIPPSLGAQGLLLPHLGLV